MACPVEVDPLAVVPKVRICGLMAPCSCPTLKLYADYGVGSLIPTDPFYKCDKHAAGFELLVRRDEPYDLPDSTLTSPPTEYKVVKVRDPDLPASPSAEMTSDDLFASISVGYTSCFEPKVENPFLLSEEEIRLGYPHPEYDVYRDDKGVLVVEKNTVRDMALVLPAYDFAGRPKVATRLLRQALASIAKQTIVKRLHIFLPARGVSIVLPSSAKNLHITLLEGKPGLAANANVAFNEIRRLEALRPRFKIIYMLMQDDLFLCHSALEKAFWSLLKSHPPRHWAVLPYTHRDYDPVDDAWTGPTYDQVDAPHLNPDLYPKGVNGAYSVSTLPDLHFDESLRWLVDVEFYSRLHKTYGKPAVASDEANPPVKPLVCVRLWEGSGHRAVD